MLNKKILIAALTLALCTTAFASCGRNVNEEGGSSDAGSVTESASGETETKNTETTGTSSESSGTVTSGTVGTTETEGGETTGMDSGSDSATLPDGGDIVGRIGEDAQNGMDNVKRGVGDFFNGEDAMPHAPRGHRGRVPSGK